MTDDDYSVGDEMVEGELKRQEDHFKGLGDKGRVVGISGGDGALLSLCVVAVSPGASHDYWP